MKSKSLAALLLGLAVCLVVSIGFTGCSTAGAVQQKNIAASCATITAATNAIAAAVEQGQVSKADGRRALALAKPTKSFCEPVPADHLSPADYASLLTAAADLATLKKEKVP